MKKLLLAALAAALWCIPAFAQQTTASLSNPVGGNIFAAGANCANVSVCIWQKLPTTATTTTVTITGTFSATLIVESSADGGTTWTQQSSQTAPAVVTFTTTSLTDVRVRCSAFVSGIASANIQTAGNQINVTASSGGATGSTFYAATSCAGLANCVTLVDDDTTDNCGTAFTNWIASINAFTGPGFAQIYFIGSGTGKGFLFKTCRIVITVSHEVTNQATLDFGSTQTPANCIQQGAGTLTSGYSTGGVSIDWRFHGGYLTGCTGATTAGMESMPWMGHGYLQNVNINNFGPAGNTPGLCTKSAIKVDIIAESHITGVQTADNRANSCAIADAMDCGSSVSCTGPASGQNTGHYSDNTILSTNSPCGSVGIWEGGTHSSVYGTSIWGFAVPLLLASGNSGGGSWMVVGNTLDEAGCAANGVAAAIQFGHSGSGQVQGPATIIGNDIPGGGSHNLSGIGIAGNSTDTIRGVNFSDNSSALTAIPILWAATVGCTTSLGLYPCFVGMNPGFNALNPNQAGTGWVSSFEGGQFGALSLSAQTANLGATNVTGNITVNPYARINCSITQTNVATTATIPTCTVSYTDVVSNTVQTRTLTSASSANVAGTNSSGMVWVALKAGTNVTVTTAGYASTGTAMQYSILATVVGE